MYYIAIFLLLVIILLQVLQVPTRNVTPQVTWAEPLVHVERTPEYRPPPLKEYKPARFQQLGILKGNEGEILPLYGKETHGHRNRYHYYTASPGQQLYALPVKHNSRDCFDDVGCEEFLGNNESVEVEGLEGTYSATIYRNNHVLY